MKFFAGTIGLVSAFIFFFALIGHLTDVRSEGLFWILALAGRPLLLLHFVSSCIVGVAAGFLSYMLLRWSRGLRSRNAATEADIGSTRALKPESPLRLIGLALGWILVAAGVGVLPIEGLFVAAFAGATFPLGRNTFLMFTYIGLFGFAAVLLMSARVRGRIVGGGDIAIGLGNTPIARQRLVAGRAFLAALYALVLGYTGHKGFPGLLFRDLQLKDWLYGAIGVLIVGVGPLSEELFLRGWLWTGLCRRWGHLLTALVTSGFWLVLYINIDWSPMGTNMGLSFTGMIILIPIAILLPLARHFGQSVRAPLLVHLAYNLMTWTGLLL